MNTKELLSIARFCYTRFDDNDITGIERHEGTDEDSETRLHTVDGVTYCVPDQEAEVIFENGVVLNFVLKAELPGRLTEDRQIEATLELQKLLPLTAFDLQVLGAKALAEPM